MCLGHATSGCVVTFKQLKCAITVQLHYSGTVISVLVGVLFCRALGVSSLQISVFWSVQQEN